MTDARVARRYAGALFSAARKQDIVHPVESDLETIHGLLVSRKEFGALLRNPDVTPERKLAFLEKVFSDRVTALTMAALRLLVQKRREDLIAVVYLRYAELRREAESVARVVVTSAYPLDEAERDRIALRVGQQTGRTIEASYEVDPKLIGGVRVAYDDYVLDGSVRGNLKRLRQTILTDLLKQA